MGRRPDDLNRFFSKSLALGTGSGVRLFILEAVERPQIVQHSPEASRLPHVELSLGLEGVVVSLGRCPLLELLGVGDLLLQLFDRVGSRLDHSQLVVELGDGVH